MAITKFAINRYSIKKTQDSVKIEGNIIKEIRMGIKFLNTNDNITYLWDFNKVVKIKFIILYYKRRKATNQ